MSFKVILIWLLCLNMIACSNTAPSSQKSNDTRACNAISYGNMNVNTQSMDSIYKKCMADKRTIRKKQSDDAEKLAIIDFFLSLFWPSAQKN